jgi:hypothetical protein
MTHHLRAVRDAGASSVRVPPMSEVTRVLSTIEQGDLHAAAFPGTNLLPRGLRCQLVTQCMTSWIAASTPRHVAVNSLVDGRGRPDQPQTGLFSDQVKG